MRIMKGLQKHNAEKSGKFEVSVFKKEYRNFYKNPRCFIKILKKLSQF